jgi:hypothetical protein
MHVTDWLPTLMGLATNGEWSSSNSVSGKEVDGVDMWSAIINDEESPRSEIVHFVDGEDYSIQYYLNGSILKMNNDNDPPDVESPTFVFLEDKNPSLSHVSCEATYSNIVNGPNHFDPAIDDTDTVEVDSTDPESLNNSYFNISWTAFSLYSVAIITILAFLSITVGFIRKAINRKGVDSRIDTQTSTGDDGRLIDETISLTKDVYQTKIAAANADHSYYLKSLPDSYQNSPTRDDYRTTTVTEVGNI